MPRRHNVAAATASTPADAGRGVPRLRTSTLPAPAPTRARSATRRPTLGLRGLRSRAIPSGGYARSVWAISLGGLLFRIALLGHQPLWRDEAFTELAARRSLFSMLDVVRHDSAPPLSYLVTHLAVAVSSSPVVLRLPAAVLGGLAVPLAAALGRRLGGDRAGTHSAALVAVMPAFVVSARDARMYALAGMLTLAMMLCLWRAVERPDRGRLVLLALSVAAALLTQYLTILVVVSAAVCSVLALRPARDVLLRVVAAMAAGVVPLLLWLPAALPQFEHVGVPFWVLPLGGQTLLGVLTQFFAGPPVDNGFDHRALLQFFQAGAITLGGIAGLWLLMSLVRMRSAQRRAHALLAGSGFGAIVLLMLLSLHTPYFEARYASVMWTPLAVLLGVGVARMRPRLLASLPLGAMAVASALLVWLPTRSDVAALAPVVDGSVRGSDIVLADPDLYLQARAGFDAEAAVRTHVAAASVPWYWGVAVYPSDAFVGAVPRGAGRVLVLTHPEREAPQLTLPSGYRRSTPWRCATDACIAVYTR